MHCQHPSHVGLQGQKCRKNLQSETRTRTAEITMRMLQTWAAWGATLGSQDEHKAIWSDVEEAAANGTLPLVPEPPEVFSAAPGGEPLVPRRWQQPWSRLWCFRCAGR